MLGCVFAVPHYGIEENSATNDVDLTTHAIHPTDRASSLDLEQTHNSASGSESLPTTPVLMTPISKCGSVGFSLGTPIEAGDVVSGDTPAKSLPDRSLFAVGVSDHILYENLPNATGTFMRLREVIRSLHSSSPAATSSPR